MGLLDWLSRGTRSTSTVEAPVRAALPATTTQPPTTTRPSFGDTATLPLGEVGATGTYSPNGDPQAEQNPALRGILAYGTANSLTWGAWEYLARTDPAIAQALEFVSAPIRDARIDVEPAPETAMPDRVLAQTQADFVRWCLLEAMEPGWAEYSQQAVRTMLAYGFALHELVWDDVQHETLPGGRGLGVRKLAERLPASVSTYGWIQDETGELAEVRQWPQSKGNSFVTPVMSASKVLLLTWNRNGDNFRGFSALRPVYYVARVREALLKMVAVSATREGAGIPVATAADAKALLSTGERAALQKLLANSVFHEAASVVMPAGWNLSWVYSPGANKGHILEAWNALGAVILQQLSAQQMILGVNGEGNRAVGETHYRASEAFVQGLVGHLEGALNGVGRRPYTGLSRKLVEANWGPQKAYPRIRITVKRSQMAATERVTASAAAVTAGLLTPTLEVENALRESLGYSPVDEAERAAAQAARQPPPQMPMPFVKPASPMGNPGPAPMQASACGCASDVVRASSEGFTPSRPLRPTEKVLRLAEYSSALDMARVDFERRVKPLVVEMLARAAPAVADAMKDGNPSEVAALPLDVSRLESEVKAYLDGLRATGYRQVSRELRDSKAPEALAEKREEGKPGVVVKAAAEEDERTDEADEAEEEADALVEAQQRALVRRMTERLRQELEAEALDAVRTGAPAGDVVSRVLQRQLDTAAYRTDAGAVITRVWNVGRDEAARVVGGVREVELSAVLDGNQCMECGRKDGQRYAFGSAEHDANVPPLRDCEGGPRCRCLLLYLPDDGGEE